MMLISRVFSTLLDDFETTPSQFHTHANSLQGERKLDRRYASATVL